MKRCIYFSFLKIFFYFYILKGNIHYIKKILFFVLIIIYDDTVDPWDGYGWNVPAEYIPNIEYYKEHNDPILPAGILWKLLMS